MGPGKCNLTASDDFKRESVRDDKAQSGPLAWTNRFHSE